LILYISKDLRGQLKKGEVRFVLNTKFTFNVELQVFKFENKKFSQIYSNTDSATIWIAQIVWILNKWHSTIVNISMKWREFKTWKEIWLKNSKSSKMKDIMYSKKLFQLIQN